MINFGAFWANPKQKQRKISANRIMASIKLSLAKTSKIDGTHPLYFIMSHGNRTARIATNISLMPDQWDKKKLQVTNHPQKKQLNFMLTQRKLEIEQMLHNIAVSRSVRSMTATQLKDALVAAMIGEDKIITFEEIFDKFLERKKSSTKNSYITTRNHMESFDPNVSNKRIEEIDYDWLANFEQSLQCSTNSKALYFAKICAIFNFAIDMEYTTAYPFRKFKFKKERTRKRNLPVEKLREVIFADGYSKIEQRYINFFAFQFLLIGINIVDLVNNVTINNGRIDYIRAKTGKLYSIKIEPEMQPYIDEFLTDGYLLKKRTASLTKTINNHLKRIAGITSYWSRHSWATIAQKIDIPKDVVAAALGHGGYSVTDIYIEFDMKKVDEANRKVIDYVWYNKK